MVQSTVSEMLFEGTGRDGHSKAKGPVLQYFLDDVRVFNRCNDPNRSTTLFTLLYIYGKHALEPQRPSHRVGFGFLTFLLFYRFLWNDMLARFAVRENTP